MIKRKLTQITAGFFGLMLCFTVLSRAADQKSIAVVRTERPQNKMIEHAVRTSGKVVQNQEMAVTTQPDQRVTAIYVREGERVAKGDLLFEIDQTLLDEKILNQQQEMEKQQLQIRDVKSQKEVSAQQKASSQAQAQEQYSLSTSRAGVQVSRAKKQLEQARQKLKDFQKSAGQKQEDSEVEEALTRTLEEKTSDYIAAQQELKALEWEIENAVYTAKQNAAAGVSLIKENVPFTGNACMQAVDAEVADAEPVGTEDVSAGTVSVEIADMEAADTEPVGAEVVNAEPMDEGIVDIEIAGVESVTAEIMDAGTMGMEIADMEPVGAQNVDTETADAEAVTGIMGTAVGDEMIEVPADMPGAAVGNQDMPGTQGTQDTEAASFGIDAVVDITAQTEGKDESAPGGDIIGEEMDIQPDAGTQPVTDSLPPATDNQPDSITQPVTDSLSPVTDIQPTSDTQPVTDNLPPQTEPRTVTQEELEQIEKSVRDNYSKRLEAARQKVEDAQSEKTAAEDALVQYQKEHLISSDAQNAETAQQLLEAVQAAQQAYEDAAIAANEAAVTSGRAVQMAGIAEASNSSDRMNEITYEQMELSLKKLEDLKAAKGKICAEADGLVTRINIMTGEKTGDTTAILMADLSKGYRFTADLTEDQQKYIGTGDLVSLTSANGKQKLEELPVESVTEDEENEGVYHVTVQIPDESFEIGANLTLDFSRKSEAYPVTVPLSALHLDARQQAYVLVTEDYESVMGKECRARKVSVTVLEKNESYAALAEGTLSAQQEIIVSSDKAVDDGSRVRVEA